MITGGGTTKKNKILAEDSLSRTVWSAFAVYGDITSNQEGFAPPQYPNQKGGSVKATLAVVLHYYIYTEHNR